MASKSAVDAIVAQLAEDGHLARLRDDTLQHIRDSRFARDLESLLSRRMRERLEAQRYSGGGTYDAFLDQSRRSAHVLIERIMNDVRVQAGYSYRQIVDQVRLLAENAVVAYGLDHPLSEPAKKAEFAPESVQESTELPSVLQNILDTKPSKSMVHTAVVSSKPSTLPTTKQPALVVPPIPEPSVSVASAEVEVAASEQPSHDTPANDESASLLAKARALLEAGTIEVVVSHDDDSDVSSVHTSDISISDSNDEADAQPAPRARRKRKPSNSQGAGKAKRAKRPAKAKKTQRKTKETQETSQTQPTADIAVVATGSRRSSRRLKHRHDLDSDDSS